MTAIELLGKLDWVRRSGGGWAARCPAHPDKSPSLSVREGEKGLLLHCFSGCRIEDITQAIGIGVADLFYESGMPRAESPAEREARRAVKDNISRNFSRVWRDEDITLVYTSAESVNFGIARALALAVEGDRIVLVIEERIIARP
jgi:hypothetical protein